MSISDAVEEIINLSSEDFIEEEDWCLKQAGSRAPFAANNAKVRQLGQYNLQTLKMLRELQLHLQKTNALVDEL